MSWSTLHLLPVPGERSLHSIGRPVFGVTVVAGAQHGTLIGTTRSAERFDVGRASTWPLSGGDGDLEVVWPLAADSDRTLELVLHHEPVRVPVARTHPDHHALRVLAADRSAPVSTYAAGSPGSLVLLEASNVTLQLAPGGTAIDFAVDYLSDDLTLAGFCHGRTSESWSVRLDARNLAGAWRELDLWHSKDVQTLAGTSTRRGLQLDGRPLPPADWRLVALNWSTTGALSIDYTIGTRGCAPGRPA